MNAEAIKAMLIAQRSQIDAMLAQIDEAKTVKEWFTLSEAEVKTGRSKKSIRTMVELGMIEHKWTDGGGKLYVKV